MFFYHAQPIVPQEHITITLQEQEEYQGERCKFRVSLGVTNTVSSAEDTLVDPL